MRRLTDTAVITLTLVDLIHCELSGGWREPDLPWWCSKAALVYYFVFAASVACKVVSSMSPTLFAGFADRFVDHALVFCALVAPALQSTYLLWASRARLHVVRFRAMSLAPSKV